MSQGVKLKVWGAYAAFTRPEMKVERVSYEVITPSAARGILEAIHWKPGMLWVVDRIHVLAPIRFTTVRRNEIGAKIPQPPVVRAMRGLPGTLGINAADHRQQRAALILRDVAYGIAAHVEILRPDLDERGRPLEHPAAKQIETFRRRAAKGQFFHQPYLGCREFPAAFEPADEFPPPPADLQGISRPLGLMLHDMVFTPDPKGAIIESNTGRRLAATPRFFAAVLENGVVHVPPLAAATENSA